MYFVSFQQTSVSCLDLSKSDLSVFFKCMGCPSKQKKLPGTSSFVCCARFDEKTNLVRESGFLRTKQTTIAAKMRATAFRKRNPKNRSCFGLSSISNHGKLFLLGPRSRDQPKTRSIRDRLQHHIYL